MRTKGVLLIFLAFLTLGVFTPNVLFMFIGAAALIVLIVLLFSIIANEDNESFRSIFFEDKK